MHADVDLSKLSLMDALDLATLIEIEAHQRYMKFASQLGYRGGFDPGTFFRSMAENEAKHGQQLLARRKALFGETPAKVKLDDLYDVEAPGEGSISSAMSTMQAFEVGLEAEQKAYDFYNGALPAITNAEVRKLFIELRDEETEHVEMLREAMAKLPASASERDEIDPDESPFL